MRIVSAGALLALLAAGCGSGARPQGSGARGVPRALAQAWTTRASAIADAAETGNSCLALHLADSLRDDVISAEAKLPPRLRSPLVAGVSALADRLVCTVLPQTVPLHKNPPHKPHDHHGHHGHGGDQGDQG